MDGAIYYERPEILDAIPKDRHAVIEASAGTGKTFTIEHLFVELLLTEKVNIDAVLVLTYTERAAGELRSRVRGMIERVLVTGACAEKPSRHCWTIGPQERVHLERALFSFDMAPIHTIHSFFQRVVNEHAFSSGRLFQQTLVDGEDAFRSAFRKTLRSDISCRAEYSCYLDTWLKSGHSIDDLAETLYSCHARKRPMLPRFDETALKSALAALGGIVHADGFTERMQAALKANKVNAATAKALARRAEAFSDALRDSSGDFFLADTIERVDADSIRYSLEKLASDKQWGHEITAYISALEELKLRFMTLRGIVVQLFLPLVQARLEREKRAAGQYDYDDMIAHLLQALNGAQSAALIAALRSRYRFALIDESQDTDERQWQIFTRIFLESGNRNILYLVGDPKQAIYGFRGADVYTYLEARRAICGADAPVPLASNFRSTARMVTAFNELFRQDTGVPFFRGAITYDSPLTCGKPEFRARDGRDADIAPIVIWKLDTDRKAVHAEFYLNVLGRGIAAEITHLLNGAFSLSDAPGAERTELKPSDIFILTRTESEGRRVAGFLRDAGLPFAFYKLNGLFQTPQAEHIRDLLLAVDTPFDESRRLRAWMTPFFGIPIDRLLECRNLPETDPLVKRLLEWHALARRRSFSELFSRLISESGLVRRVVFFEESERELTDYLHILEMLLEESGGGRELAELNQMLSDFISEAKMPAREDGTVQRLETDKEAVQIMTMHKSKGLEAAVVFLYGGYSAGPGDEFHLYHEADGRAVLHLGGAEDAKQLAREESEDEDRRLLYVAATRAKARLYLPFVQPEKLTSRQGMYRIMNDRLAALAVDESALQRGGFVIARTPFRAEYAATGGRDAYETMRRWSPPAHLLDLPDESERFEALLERHAGFEVTSYSRMKKMQGGYAAPAGDEENIYDDRVAEGGKAGSQDDLPGGPRFGRALHAVMESIRFDSLPEKSDDHEQWAAAEPVRAFASQALGREGVEQSHAGYLLSLVGKALMSRIPLADGAELPRLAAVQRAARELEFLYPYPEESSPRLASAQWEEVRIERGFVKGYIDMVFEWEGKLHLLDWKTDLLPDYDGTALMEHYEANYALQAKLYLIALCKMMRVHSVAEYEERIGSVVYCFVRGMSPDDRSGAGLAVTRPSWDELLSFEAELVAGRLFTEEES